MAYPSTRVSIYLFLQTSHSNELSRVPVIDMTGKEKRVLSGYHALRASVPLYEHEPRRRCEKFAAPELMHNLQLMLECTEQVCYLILDCTRQLLMLCTEQVCSLDAR